LIRQDPQAKIVGRSLIEGHEATIVESKVPTRKQVMIQTSHRISQLLGDDDRMTLIAFDHTPTILASEVPSGPILDAAIKELEQTGGGGTSMGRAMELCFQSLRDSLGKGMTQKLIVLTDGKDQEPEFATSQVRVLADQFKIPLHAFGTGECDVDFLIQLCQITRGGEFRNIEDENDANEFFSEAFDKQKKIIATNVTLNLWLSPEIKIQELYRTKPEILFMGKVSPDTQNQIEIPVQYLEKNKSYEFLFHCELPVRDQGRFRLAKATLSYDIPMLQLQNQKIEANIVVEFTDDIEKAKVQIGDVRRVVSQAEVQRQLLFMQEKIRLIESGAASDKDKTIVAKLLEVLIARFQELGDQASANRYQDMKNEFLKTNKISVQTMNQSLAASSKVADNPGIVDIEDF
jgi:Ca-activated chloride channel family protein